MQPAPPTTQQIPRNALIKIPRQPRSIQMVHNILDAGILVIEADGVAAMSTNRVAERAGVSIGSLYQYFPNRECLLAGIIERSQGTVVEQVAAYKMMSLKIPLEELLTGSLKIMMAYYAPYAKVVREILREMPILAENSIALSIEKSVFEMTRDYMVHNSDKYKFSADYADSYIAVNSLVFAYLRWLVSPHPMIMTDDLIRSIVKQFMYTVQKI